MRATLILGAVTMMALGACDQARPEHAVASLGASSPDALLDELRRMRPAASSAAPADAPLRCCGSASGRAAVEAAMDLHDALAAGSDGLREGYAVSAAMSAFAADPLTPEATREVSARAAAGFERARDRGPTALRDALAAAAPALTAALGDGQQGDLPVRRVEADGQTWLQRGDAPAAHLGAEPVLAEAEAD
ncbi:MAG: hypothetical protein IPO67_10390 [Deltaproteobacteria bacterium]|nr:hypothetical protein [Deltaproteobacteria bacterium]MBK9371465.1 hypothetical protein [Deltaproteobacteria bacterium]MBK9645540.1 hypothetical protein [Deltaproteobacteria bacterium]